MRYLIKCHGNGCVGYIESVSYSKNKFTTTQNRSEAKKSYRTLDEVQREIDILSRMCCGTLVFTYDFA